MAKVAVVGAGAWGTTLAAIVGRQEPVLLLSHSAETAERIQRERRNERRLPGIELPDGLEATADPERLREATDLVIVAVPSQHVRDIVKRIAPFVPASVDVLSVVKGLERGTLLRMTEVIADAKKLAALGKRPLVVLTRGLGAGTRWQAAQKELANLSTNAKQVIATRSGHFIQTAQPDLVVSWIRRVLDSVRTGASMT